MHAKLDVVKGTPDCRPCLGTVQKPQQQIRVLLA